MMNLINAEADCTTAVRRRGGKHSLRVLRNKVVNFGSQLRNLWLLIQPPKIDKRFTTFKVVESFTMGAERALWQMKHYDYRLRPFITLNGRKAYALCRGKEQHYLLKYKAGELTSYTPCVDDATGNIFYLSAQVI